MVTKHETEPAESKAEKKGRQSIDLGPLMMDAISTLPEGCEIEVSSLGEGGKRIDLVRTDGSIVRLTYVKSMALAGAFLEGIAIGRRIQ